MSVIDLEIEEQSAIDLEVSEQIVLSNTDPYTGPYEYTPTQETQTVPINGLRATENIVINPIPSNYGLISWNGSVLTVS